MRHEIRLLGPWELRIDDRAVVVPGVRMRILLTSLALSADQPVDLDTLAGQLWPERAPLRPHRTLHTYVARLRKLLGPEAIRSKPCGGYRLTIATEAVDLHRFRDLERHARVSGSPGEELAALRSGLELWRGVPFADLYSTWLDRDVLPGLTDEWFAATSRRIELELATQPPERLVAELQALADRHPTRERGWLLLITALHRAGRRADALDGYRRARAILQEELGIEPGEQLARLQREILVDGTREGVPPPRQLPHDIPRFTGRGNELARLDGLLADPGSAQPPVVVAIGGAPGVGKTTLAVHWAHRMAHRHPDAQLYLNLRGYGSGQPLTPEAAAAKLLRALGVPSALIPSELDERFALLRGRLSMRAALIVLDNARDAEQVRPLLPGNGLVIVTSRSRLPGLSTQHVTLHPLSQQHSIELLTAGSADTVAAAELAELCGRLPLALAIVAERAQRAGSLAQVAAELASERSRLDALDAGEDQPNTSLRAALSWSYRALSPEPAALFRKLGRHPARVIEIRAAAALADLPVSRVRALLDQLVCAHLVERPRPDRYELHNLIRLYATELADEEDSAAKLSASTSNT